MSTAEPVKPSITPTLIERIREYYRVPGNEVGGSLHIVLDDGNIADDHVAWAVQYAEENGDDEGVALGKILLAMSRTQRNKLAAMTFYPWES